jgi:hypothetical protein
MPVRASTTCGQKRKCSPGSDSTAESTPLSEPPWKRAGFQSAEEANVAFWDDLPKVPLCLSALKEFDRRNPLTTIGPKTKSAARHTKRITKSAARHAAQLSQLRPIVLEDYAAPFKYFARRGGPDLQDLRGVWMAQDDSMN